MIMKIASTSIWKFRIIYCDSAWGKKCAERIRNAIYKREGVRLPMYADTAEPYEYEIIVGKTNRAESIDIRATYDRPNIYYDVSVRGCKLVCMAEGFTTLDRVACALEKAIAAEDNITGVIARGELRDEPDGNMIDKACGTDVRVFDWNLNAPENTGENWLENAERAADTMLRHLPDIIGTNEIYDSISCVPYKRFYDAVMRELADYYTEIKDSPYDEGQPTDNIVGDPARYGTPPHHILYRRDARFDAVASGFRYTPNLVAYHGYHWAVFEKPDGKRFIFSVGHYEDTRNNPVCAIGHMEAVDFAQKKLGEKELLPTIITGDLFTHIGCAKGGYNAFIDAGYSDAQREAEINCNGDITYSTYHRTGKYHPRWASIDLVMCNARIKALKFKVITSQEALDVSDHCPVCADLKFN